MILTLLFTLLNIIGKYCCHQLDKMVLSLLRFVEMTLLQSKIQAMRQIIVTMHLSSWMEAINYPVKIF
jgi:hypothetical protein